MKRLVPLFLLLALLAAVPLSLKPLLRARFERAEADAFAAYPPPADTNGPAFPKIPVDDGLPQLRRRFSATVQPLPPDYFEAVRAWCASNPAAIAAFDRVTDPEHPFRPTRAFDIGDMGDPNAYAVLGESLLREAVERGDAARVEDLDRRLRSFARMLGAPLVPKLYARAVGRFRLSILPRALPLLPDAYLDECDADARERIRTAAADAVFAFGADLPGLRAFLEDLRGENGSESLFFRANDRSKNPFLRYASDCDDFLSSANSYRIYANVPAAIARCEALFGEPRAAFPDGLAEAGAILVDGCCEQWPRSFAVVKDRWTLLHSFFLVGTVFPVVPCYADVRNDAELERLVIALERHRRRTGSYPARLADLVGGDEDALPRMFPTGDPPDYEAGDLPVRVQRLAVRLDQDDEEPEDGEPTSAVFRGYRLRVRPSPRLQWSTHGHGCEFSSDCVYHLDAGTLCAPSAEPDLHAEPDPHAEPDLHAEPDPHAEPAE